MNGEGEEMGCGELGEGLEGGRRMSSIHPAGWPAPVLLKPEERYQTPQQMRHGPSPPTGAPSRAQPTDRKTVNESRWLGEGKQRQLGSSGRGATAFSHPRAETPMMVWARAF